MPRKLVIRSSGELINRSFSMLRWNTTVVGRSRPGPVRNEPALPRKSYDLDGSFYLYQCLTVVSFVLISRTRAHRPGSSRCRDTMQNIFKNGTFYCILRLRCRRNNCVLIPSVDDDYGQRHEKTNVLVSDPVRHKSGCTATEDG